LLEALRSLPETERAFLTETASSLSDEEIAALADEISSISAAEMARQVNILRENPPSDWGFREYAAERFVTKNR
jgi:cytochrome c553